MLNLSISMCQVLEWQVVNTKKPLWLRSPKECAAADYEEFYKQTFKAYDTPLAHSHFTVEVWNSLVLRCSIIDC